MQGLDALPMGHSLYLRLPMDQDGCARTMSVLPVCGRAGNKYWWGLIFGWQCMQSWLQTCRDAVLEAAAVAPDGNLKRRPTVTSSAHPLPIHVPVLPSQPTPTSVFTVSLYFLAGAIRGSQLTSSSAALCSASSACCCARACSRTDTSNWSSSTPSVSPGLTSYCGLRRHCSTTVVRKRLASVVLTACYEGMG